MIILFLNFSHDWAVYQIYPRTSGANEALAPGENLQLGLSIAEQYQLIPHLAPQFDQAREFIKVIATLKEVDLGLLQMPPLKSADQVEQTIPPEKQNEALQALGIQVKPDTHRRSPEIPPQNIAQDWFTYEIAYRLIR